MTTLPTLAAAAVHALVQDLEPEIRWLAGKPSRAKQIILPVCLLIEPRTRTVRAIPAGRPTPVRPGP